MKRVRWFVLFALALAAFALPASAFAAPHASQQCKYPDTNCTVPSSVLPATVTSGTPGTSGTSGTSATTANVAPANVSAGQSSLPFTGGDIAGLVAIGVGAILVGFLLARTRRGTRTRS
jgi:hypothetical protein